ncbi:MAG: hypothetical protein EBS05_20520 [Proteobacteria bacterium]|nr:hypothetical protein [Pseudomonadota bacterium]
MKLLRRLLCLGLLSAAAFAGAEQPFHVYAPSHTTGKLLVASATPTANGLELKLAQEIKLGFPVSTIAQHPTRPLLYLAPPSGEEGKAKGAVITLQNDGAYLRHAEFMFSHPSAYLSLDQTRRFLLSADYGKGFVDIYALDETGVPGKRVTALNEGRPTAHCIRTSPDNRFAYVSYVKENNALYQYRFEAATGQLTALEPKNVGPPEGTGPRHMAFHPSKPVLYFSNEQHLGVSAYNVEPSGQLKLRQVCDAVSKDEPRDGVSSSDILVTPDGRYLFAGIRGHSRAFDWISRYRVKENGDLELLGLTPADKVPWGLAFSPTGEHLLVTAFDGATLTAYKITAAGDLTKAGSLTWDKQIFAIVTR